VIAVALAVETIPSTPVETVPQEEFVPSVVKYLPEFDVCVGSASTVFQEVLDPSVDRNFPEFDVWVGIVSGCDDI
jgi:hypothetical protein